MPSGRPSDPRKRAQGSGPRGSTRRTSTGRPGARPGAGTGPRRGAPRPRTAAAREVRPRARVTGRAAILVLVLAMLMVSYASSLRAYIEQRHHLAGLRADIASSQANIDRLEREKKRWNDPAYVRTVAHQRFGWVLPGEIGFQVLDEDGKPLGHTDTLSDPSTVTEASRPLWWQAAWGSVVAAGTKPVDQSDVPPPATKIRPPEQPKEPQQPRGSQR
jgi:cell division protein FtsB